MHHKSTQCCKKLLSQYSTFPDSTATVFGNANLAKIPREAWEYIKGELNRRQALKDKVFHCPSGFELFPYLLILYKKGGLSHLMFIIQILYNSIRLAVGARFFCETGKVPAWRKDGDFQLSVRALTAVWGAKPKQRQQVRPCASAASVSAVLPPSFPSSEPCKGSSVCKTNPTLPPSAS